ncbi:MAG: NAD-dependent epimerase/dehydratase family protein [Streptosporangiales bacterium]|nr:NAD-dependent epimerase/dehydratase family protein [Streptosporangiales bacterium]
MKVLLTGASGFIGGQVASVLTASGHHVLGLDVRPSADRAGPPVTEADIRDAIAMAEHLAGVDVLVHQAARVGLGVDLDDMPGYADTNVTGTAVLLAAAARAGVRRLVLASSMVVYGEGGYACSAHGDVRPGPRTPEDLQAGRFEPRCPDCGAELTHRRVAEDAPPDPRNAYATTKLAQEHLAATWARETGGAAVALRYHNVYGPGMPRDTPYAGVAAIFRSALARGEAPRVFEDGRQRRDFVHVSDVARANMCAVDATAGLPPGTLRAYNVASGRPRTIGDLAVALATACGGPAPVVTGEFRLGDVRHIVATPDRATRELGFTAHTDLTEGVRSLT